MYIYIYIYIYISIYIEIFIYVYVRTYSFLAARALPHLPFYVLFLTHTLPRTLAVPTLARPTRHANCVSFVCYP